MLLLYYGYRLLTVARVMGSKNLKTLCVGRVGRFLVSNVCC